MLKSTERDAWIGLGTNVGDRSQHLRTAVAEIRALRGTRLLGCSSFRITPPVGPEQPDFLNGVVRIASTLSPMELLIALKGLERLHEREKTQRWGPRTLDLDLLLYGDRIIQHPLLVVPHPEMHRRRFVLEPMCELDSSRRHPSLDRTVSELLKALL